MKLTIGTVEAVFGVGQGIGQAIGETAVEVARTIDGDIHGQIRVSTGSDWIATLGTRAIQIIILLSVPFVGAL